MTAVQKLALPEEIVEHMVDGWELIFGRITSYWFLAKNNGESIQHIQQDAAEYLLKEQIITLKSSSTLRTIYHLK